MIDKLKPHERYKITSSRWIGQVPDHWELRKLRTLITPRNERNRPDLPLLSVARERGVFVRSAEDANHNIIPEDLSNYKVARAGSLVINKMKAWQGSMGIAPCDGIVSPAYFVYDFCVANPAFGQALLRSRPYVSHFAQASDGVRIGQWDLSIHGMREIVIALPPPDEQDAIVRVLEYANRCINHFIRAKLRLVALLNEQKRTIIHHAVTRGLDAGAPVSELGHSFIEHIPTHWPVVRAKLLFRQVVPSVPDNAEQVTCFRDGQVTLRRNRRTTGFTNAIFELGYQGIAIGQLVLHSMDAFAGAIGVSDSNGKCSPEYVICVPAMEGVSPYYYGYLLRSLALRGLFVALCPSVRERAPRVRFSDFGAFVLPKPPISEQHQIVRYIQEACGRLNASLTSVQREIALTQEYRTRLIADIVTGQVDVREAAAGLPVEHVELEDAITVPDDEIAGEPDPVDELEAV
jgi:type I restriction enzyme, S subunit